MPRPTFAMELISRRMLSQKTLGLTFHVTDPPTFEAGQFISILFDHEGESLKRSYSIASTPEQLATRNELEIAIGLIDNGKASSCFAMADVGQQFAMQGAFGLLTLSAALNPSANKHPKRIILVGTGTGMAPYRAMLPALEQHSAQGLEIHLLMGSRDQADLLFQNEFQASAARCATITNECCLSRATKIDTGKGEYAGYVQDRLTQLQLTPEQDVVYLCGHPAMIDDCVTMLTNMGFGPRDIKREKYTFSR